MPWPKGATFEKRSTGTKIGINYNLSVRDANQVKCPEKKVKNVSAPKMEWWHSGNEIAGKIERRKKKTKPADRR